MNIKIKNAPHYEARLYIGSRENYDGPAFDVDRLHEVIKDFQNEHLVDDVLIPVRVTATTYRAGDYSEDGWEVAVINYPRKPRDRIILESFMFELAQHLLDVLKQNRISVVTPEKIVMFESDVAVEKASCHCEKE